MYYLWQSLLDNAEWWLTAAQKFGLFIFAFTIVILSDRAQHENKKARDWLRKFFNKRSRL